MKLDPNIYIPASFTDAKKVLPRIPEMAEKVPLLQEKMFSLRMLKFEEEEFQDLGRNKWMYVNDFIIINYLHFRPYHVLSPLVINVLYDPCFNLSPLSMALDIPVHLVIGCHYFTLMIKYFTASSQL